jgi:hypothetical protein
MNIEIFYSRLCGDRQIQNDNTAEKEILEAGGAIVNRFYKGFLHGVGCLGRMARVRCEPHSMTTDIAFPMIFHQQTFTMRMWGEAFPRSTGKFRLTNPLP